MGYKDMSVSAAANAQQASHLSGLSNVPAHQTARPNEASSYGMQQSLDLRGNLGNLSHIVDRFPTDERMLPSTYYGDKGMSGPNMFSKPSATSASSKRLYLFLCAWYFLFCLFLGLPIFSQPNVALPYGHEMQAAAGTMYNRQLSELQNATNVDKNNTVQPDKKSKRRKSAKNGKCYKLILIAFYNHKRSLFKRNGTQAA